MTGHKIAPYGTWDSPISPDDFAAGAVILDQVYVNQANGKIYLLEIRPNEDGKGRIVEFSQSGAKDVLPAQFNALTSVHEYGGASFVTRDTDGHIIFSDFDSKVVYDLDPDSQETTPVVEEDSKVYFADFNEDHHSAKIEDVENSLVVINTTTKKLSTFAKGADFYAFPRFSPNGRRVCWTQWNHPNMPWNYTELWVADWDDGHVSNERVIAGREAKASITQPCWGIDESLFFVDDRTGYWQIYQSVDDHVRHIIMKGLEKAEFAQPDWWLGSSTYASLTKDKIVAVYNMDSAQKIVVVDVKTGDYIDPEYTINFAPLNALKRISDTSFAIIGDTAKVPTAFYHLDITKPTKMDMLKASTKIGFSDTYFSMAENIKYPRTHGPGGGHAYGLYYPPTNPDYKGPDGSLPPLIVVVHGGPTSQEFPGVFMRDQFWTTRGYALVQVTHVGSSGYGKEYQDLLKRQWGISDIADAVSCVDYLVGRGLVDSKRIGITGHSAGGYATLNALAAYPDVWAAGVAESGISDMQAMFNETHKYESQYLIPLMFDADTPSEDKERIIKERSPIHIANRIKAPLLILSGAADNIVPPNQAYMMADKVRAGGKSTVEVKVYDGEGHNFAQGSTLKDMEVRQEKWFRKYLVGE